MHNFDYKSPKSLNEITNLLVTNGNNARLLAGGTDLIVNMRAGKTRPSLVIDAKCVSELNELTLDNKGLLIGAAVSSRRIWEDTQIADIYPALIDSAI